MTRTLTLSFVLALGLISLVACGDSEEATQIREGLDQAWDGLKAWTVKEREQAESTFDAALEGLEDDLEAAKKKAAAAGDDAASSLDQKWADLSQKLEELKASSAEDWETAQTAFRKAYETFQAEMRAKEEER